MKFFALLTILSVANAAPLDTNTKPAQVLPVDSKGALCSEPAVKAMAAVTVHPSVYYNSMTEAVPLLRPLARMCDLQVKPIPTNPCFATVKALADFVSTHPSIYYDDRAVPLRELLNTTIYHRRAPKRPYNPTAPSPDEVTQLRKLLSAAADTLLQNDALIYWIPDYANLQFIVGMSGKTVPDNYGQEYLSALIGLQRMGVANRKAFVTKYPGLADMVPEGWAVDENGQWSPMKTTTS